ncbi:MAG: hypothetical protein M3317_06565 [Actinomycetota bacterium]|nr:hypothetical protein [Actinomycetota bacterium]
MQNLRREKGFEIEESIRVGLSGNPRVSSLWKAAGGIISRPRCWRANSPSALASPTTASRALRSTGRLCGSGWSRSVRGGRGPAKWV